MRIGIDFDNTLVCYDQLFWSLAFERLVIEESIPIRKDAVRDDLRQRGLESIWTNLQGEAYGPRILEASPFPGVLAALDEFRRRDWTVMIISHKTRTPIAGVNYDLHAAALSWLTANGILDQDATNITPDHVFFELTKREKLQRIADVGCDWFIDDLPELLTDIDFPTGVRRILFDPHRQSQATDGISVVNDWQDLVSVLTAETHL